MSQLAKNLLGEQRKRAVGALMQHIETHVYPHIPEQAQQDLRAKVLSTVSSYHDVCLDLLKASVRDGMTLNDEALRMIADMHRDIQALRRDS